MQEPLRDLDIESRTERFEVGLSRVFDWTWGLAPFGDTMPRTSTTDPCADPAGMKRGTPPAAGDEREAVRPLTCTEDLAPKSESESEAERPGRSVRSLELGVRLSWAQNTTTLLGEPFSFSPGAVQGKSRTTALRLSQVYLHRSQPESEARARSLALSSKISLGVDALDATIHGGSLPDSRFVAWLLQVAYRRELGWRDTELLARGAAQLASEPLLPLERFTVGGALSVRGYRENTLVGDEGYFIGAELRYPWPDPPVVLGAPTRLQLALFADLGGAWSHGHRRDRQDLASVGAGVLLALPRHLEASLYLAHAFNDVPPVDQYNLQDDGIYFRVVVGY